MATLLDERLVTDALRGLDEWTGGADRISRTIRLDDADGLLAAIAETANSLDHHPEVERSGDRITFVLWTHSEGGVTELDIALASRIDDLIMLDQHKVRDATGHVREAADETDESEDGDVTPAPAYPTDGATTPSRARESATGVERPEGPPTGPPSHIPTTSRQDAGPAVVPPEGDD